MEKRVQEMLHNIIEGKTYDEALIQAYFSPDYVQVVDGKQLDFKAFKQHIKKLKELIERVAVEVCSTAVRDQVVFTKHQVESVLRDGTYHKHLVMAEFTFQDGKIIRCEELTFLLEGSASGKDLGSKV
ncbi:hypothetical protein H4K35_04210 [Myroides sp. NP-2]|uniref:nuclear transport factor 2 family protein n=1 Tax=Myroides sp. NP-2 TaxID=2759945 RepID=UPI0015F908E8|nr:nuclear transport factor 2 family protein [Myroides sp. NP-2]MBB1149344.1 hypothetical protein [Myroides sp. NP-2]